MSDLKSSINVAVSGTSTLLGGGTQGTKIFFKKAKKFVFTRQGYIFDGNVDFTNEYIDTLIASGDVTVIEGVNDVDEDNVANAYEDIGGGITSIDELGLYGIIAKFRGSTYFDGVLDSMSGTGVYDVCAIDNEGKLMGTLASDGVSLKGFTLGVHQKELTTGVFDSNSDIQNFKMQFLNTYELSNRAVKFKDDDFDGRSLQAINEIKIVLTTPADGDTSVTVKASYRQGGEVFTGLTFGQWNIKINGVTANPTGGDDSVTDGTYVLTGVTAISSSDVVSVSLYDNANSRAGVKVGSYLYKSSTVSKTAI